MTDTTQQNSAEPNDRDLVLTRLIDATPEALFRCWTEPELIKLWFAPKPWSVPSVKSDLRPGGVCNVTMADENGNEYPSPGQYLEIVPNQKLVFTDAYVGDWQPSPKAFFTCILTFTPEGGKTRYTAVARHWTPEDRKAHEEIGFYEGWSLCAAQMEEVARGL